MPVLWRCFPWDTGAAAQGSAYSPSHVAAGQRAGRFDLRDSPSVLYLGEDPAHVVAEALQAFRNTSFVPAMLRRHGHPLALVEVTVPDEEAARIADLCDPAALVRHDIAPDRTAHHDRQITQAIARRLHESGSSGLRWWSTITGAWHVWVVFLDRIPAEAVGWAVPQGLAADSELVLEARKVLGITSGGASVTGRNLPAT
ncbi:MAG: RES family NAD+ phosphorylase [Gemmatimonadales bacterium]